MQIKLLIIGYNKVIINRKIVISKIFGNFCYNSFIGYRALAIRPIFALKGGKSEKSAP